MHLSSGTCPPGMVLHIKGYALQGLISPRHHSNVNHISSLNLSNICTTSLTNLLIAQKPYTDPPYKVKATKGQPIGSTPTRAGKFPQGVIQNMYSDVIWFWGCLVIVRPRAGVVCGCLCRRRAVPVMDAIFPSPYCLIFLYLHFLLQALTKRTLPWLGGQS